MRERYGRFAMTCSVALVFLVAGVVALQCVLHSEAFADERKEVVCWGDSMTSGMGAGKARIKNSFEKYNASNKSYPEILEHFTGLPTYNFGVPGAKSDEIAYMQGGLKKLANGDRPKENARSEDDEDDEDYEDYDETTIDFDIMKKGKKHPGDVLVLEIGSNGGWKGDYKVLIKQYKAMIKHAKCSDYIILGDTDDPGCSIADTRQKPFKAGRGPGETAWEAALSKEFGNHFINMRVYLIKNGLADAGLTTTTADKVYAAKGWISPQLRADWTHLNSFGYYAKAKAVYDRGVKLGYW